jgi:hypothetical protein
MVEAIRALGDHAGELSVLAVFVGLSVSAIIHAARGKQ